MPTEEEKQAFWSELERKHRVPRAKQVRELIKALRHRRKQLCDQGEGVRVGYDIHGGHHLRDVMTVLAVLEGDENAEGLLKNMPGTSTSIPIIFLCEMCMQDYEGGLIEFPGKVEVVQTYEIDACTFTGCAYKRA